MFSGVAWMLAICHLGNRATVLRVTRRSFRAGTWKISAGLLPIMAAVFVRQCPGGPGPMRICCAKSTVLVLAVALAVLPGRGRTEGAPFELEAKPLVAAPADRARWSVWREALARAFGDTAAHRL